MSELSGFFLVYILEKKKLFFFHSKSCRKKFSLANKVWVWRLSRRGQHQHKCAVWCRESVSEDVSLIDQ